MSDSLAGQVAFVTVGEGPAGEGPGGEVSDGEVSDGDGRTASLARALVEKGALVVLVSSDAEAGGRLAGVVGARAVFCPSDDAEADVQALVELADDLLRADRRGFGSG